MAVYSAYKKIELSMPSRFTDRITRTKAALQQTINRILDINRRKKALSSQRVPDVKDQLNEELELLNKLAKNQATLIQRYQHRIKKDQRKTAWIFSPFSRAEIISTSGAKDD